MIASAKMRTTFFVTLMLATFAVALEQDCSQQELARCARPLQVLSDTSDFHFVSNKDELNKLCPDLEKNLQCIHSYTRRCMPQPQRSHFKRLYKGTGDTIKDLCTEGPYQTKFLEFAPCLKGIRPQYENCAKNHMAAINSLSSNKSSDESPIVLSTFCCSFLSYISCSERAVKTECGEETAVFAREFLYRISSALITMHCKAFFDNPNQCPGYLIDYNRNSRLAPTLATLLLPVVLSIAVLLNTPTNSSRIVIN